jgi:hypothetical protein
LAQGHVWLKAYAFVKLPELVLPQYAFADEESNGLVSKIVAATHIFFIWRTVD